MKNTYKYDYRLQNGSWATAKYSNGNFTGLSDGKTYELRVTVTDNAGRTNFATTTATTKVANTPPYNLTTDLSSRTTNSLTVRARAYDNDSPAQTLTYTLSLNGQTRTATGTSGNYVTFSAVSGLSEYTTYSWTVTVKDTNNATISGSASDRTYCSGANRTCSKPSGTCTACNGTISLCKNRHSLISSSSTGSCGLDYWAGEGTGYITCSRTVNVTGYRCSVNCWGLREDVWVTQKRIECTLRFWGS
jgi:hypothetical protein